jgi:uncharacterized protein
VTAADLSSSAVSPEGTQTAVVFPNRAGLRLFGILHTPPERSHDLGVIVLSPGVKMRVGPQRLYKGLADQCVRLGLPVFRFDFYGLGDSEGTLTEDLLRDLYNHIEVGRFVNDALDAMDWMETHCGTKRFILSGLCGGAITGLLAGSRDARVAGLLALGITPVLASRAAEASRYMTAGELQQSRRRYMRRLLSPEAWFRLLTLKADYRLIGRFITEPFRRRVSSPTAAPAVPPEDDNANRLFPPAFFSMLDAKRPMLLVFGGVDRLLFEFEEKFVARHKTKLAEAAPLYQVHSVKDANHVLSLPEWQAEMLQVADRWLRQHFSRQLASQA